MFGLLLLQGLHVFLIRSYQEEQVQERNVNLQYYGTRLTGQIRTGDDGKLQLSQDQIQEINTIADMYSGRVLVVDASCNIIEDTYVIDEGRIAVSPEIFQCLDGANYSHLNSAQHYMEMALPVTDSITKTNIGAVFISSSTMDIYNNVRKMDRRIGMFMMLVIIVLAIVSVTLGHLISTPFRRTLASLKKVGEGNIGAPLYHSSIREFQELTEEYERILQRVQYQDQSRQEFVSNVSHELKTPIASMKVLADSLITQKGQEVPVEIYEDFMADISEELDRETQIINDLLTLSRLDHATEDSLQTAPVDIGSMIEMNLKRLRPLAKKREIELVYESIRPVTAEVDETRLSLAVMNLIENAIKYNRDGGWVKVVCDADHRFCYIRVADSGIGIPKEDLNKVFDRFYRVDKARSRESGGTGLGLNIAQSIILLHGGAVRVNSVLGEGTTFTVRIPLKHVA